MQNVLCFDACLSQKKEDLLATCNCSIDAFVFSSLHSALRYLNRVRIRMRMSPVPSVAAGPSRETVNAGQGWMNWMFFPQCPLMLLHPWSLRIKYPRKAEPLCKKEIVPRVC